MIASTTQPHIVRYGELIPCRTAFIDAHTPGSEQKENFTIIGAGVSEGMDQHVHINATPGFNIGAAGQPPGCINSLHSHTTAEVFFVLHGRWRFFWGPKGDSGEVVLEQGDLINIPTGIFRGFKNIGQDYGMLMAILGGDDAGGGVTWAPHVLTEAYAHGLILSQSGTLYDTKQGQCLPDNELPQAQLTPSQLAAMPDYTVAQVVPQYVARYWDMLALAKQAPCSVIAEAGMIKDKPGFTVEMIGRTSIGTSMQTAQHPQVLMMMRGHWQLTCAGNTYILNSGDTCLLPLGIPYQLQACVSGEASLFRVTKTDDEAGATYGLAETSYHT